MIYDSSITSIFLNKIIYFKFFFFFKKKKLIYVTQELVQLETTQSTLKTRITPLPGEDQRWARQLQATCNRPIGLRNENREDHSF